MITLSNGHRFEYMAASGALAFDGRGWPWEWPLRWLRLLDPRQFTIVTKTLTRYPRRGNLRWWKPFGCVRFVSGGTVNAVGLTNPGIDWWCQRIAPRMRPSGLHIVASIASDDPDELRDMIRMLNPVPLVGIELNASCPNTQAEMMTNAQRVIDAAKAARTASRHPLLIKLSTQHHYERIAAALVGVVEAIAINSVPWRSLFSHRPSPLAHLGDGGVSGRAAQVLTWKMVQELAEVVTIPVIGPSVWEFEDLARLRRLGATAISFGAIFLRFPWRPTAFVRRDQIEVGLASAPRT